MELGLIEKLFGLLEASAGHADGRSLADLAASAGLAKPTAHRILKTLVALGYMDRVGPGVYRQAPLLRRLASLTYEDRLVRAARPVLADLHGRTQETVNLGALRQSRVVYLAVLECPQPLRRTVNPAMTDPFTCTSLGRAIVAHLPAERQAYLLKHTPVEKRTPHTIVDPCDLRRVLDQTREQGYAVEVNETDIGVACVGAPVFDADGVAAAVSVSAPTARFGPDRLAALGAEVRATADAVSARLRWADGPPDLLTSPLSRWSEPTTR